MKQKLTILFLTLAAALALAAPALADVIWEPDDPFYNRHADECTYENRRYELAGYEGTVTVYTAPGGLARTTLDNGARGTVQFVWKADEGNWGYLCSLEDSDVEGWIPMDDLTLIYDSRQFMEDHSAELVEGEAVEVDFTQAVLYAYPGGPAEYVLKEDKQYQPFSQMFTTTYTDQDGLCWGYVGYYMGHRNRWICLDDPMNEDLDTAVVEPSPSAAQLRGSPTVRAGLGTNALILAAVLVALVVAVTAVLIRKFCPKKKQRLAENKDLTF